MPPRPRNPLEIEIARGRRAFYARLARDATEAARRLSASYEARLGEIGRLIREFEGSERGRAGLETLRAGLRQELAALQAALVDAGADAQRQGAAQGYRAGLQALQRGALRVAFHVPTLNQIQATIHYVDLPAWRTAAQGLAGFHSDRLVDAMLVGIAQGQNPARTARLARDYLVLSKRPLVDALRLTRTTHLYAARRATSMTYEQHGVGEWIWSANIGSDRTCLSCICLHGTVHPVSEVLNDHHLGRCAPIPVTPKWAALGYREGRDIEIEGGADWLMRQPAETQRRIMGPRFYEAWTAGTFRLEQVPRLYDNDIFGPMWRKATLGELRVAG